ncbi:helix-turn-helix domain-containing protein [Streptomyces lasiicapitis]|uniref:helix-turn-helix domain-containing protein n=1 Tax=Streptomyces lasiicapitis TaxID=1923961 RepID=UPI00331E62B7
MRSTAVPDAFDWPRGRRITPEERERIAAELLKRYDDGTPIRALAAQAGRSYGFVHRQLAAFGATFRPRGGSRHSPQPPTPGPC